MKRNKHRTFKHTAVTTPDNHTGIAISRTGMLTWHRDGLTVLLHVNTSTTERHEHYSIHKPKTWQSSPCN